MTTFKTKKQAQKSQRNNQKRQLHYNSVLTRCNHHGNIDHSGAFPSLPQGSIGWPGPRSDLSAHPSRQRTPSHTKIIRGASQPNLRDRQLHRVTLHSRPELKRFGQTRQVWPASATFVCLTFTWIFWFNSYGFFCLIFMDFFYNPCFHWEGKSITS